MGLFQPDWMSRDRAKAMQGLKELAGRVYFTKSDRDKKLERVALKARLPEIRLTAAKAVNSHQLCYQMAKQDPDAGVRAYLISEEIFYIICDKSDLLELLSSEKDPDVRKLIQSLIDKKDQKAAEEQKKKNEAAAWERKRKARKDEYDRKVQRVKEQLKSLPQQELVKVFCEPVTQSLCGETFGAKSDVYAILRESVSFLTEQQALYEVALNTADKMTRIEDIHSPNVWSIQQTAVWLLQDQKRMEQLVINTDQNAARFALLEKIENQRFLANYIKTCPPDAFAFYCYQCRVDVNNLLNRITDRALLEEIIRDGGRYIKEADVRLQKLESETLCPNGTHSWEEIHSDSRMYDNEIIIDEYSYRCSRCGARYSYEKWGSGYSEKGKVYFVPRCTAEPAPEEPAADGKI